MKTLLLFPAALAAAALAAGAAAADCRAELDQLAGGISKDGSLAPLAGSATPQTGGGEADPASGGGEGIAKDATEQPLGTDPALATSAEDAQAQQQGGATAAEQAMGAGGAAPDGRADAIARAEAALAAGDEAGCMAAVEEAKGL
jgi:hypothetical protein